MSKQLLTHQCDHDFVRNQSNTKQTKSNVYIYTASPSFITLRMRMLASNANNPVSKTSKTFLQGVSGVLSRPYRACYAELWLGLEMSVCLSVCPSVRHMLALCQNDAQARITKSSPTDSPRTLVLAIKQFIQKFEVHPKRGR